MNNPEFRLIFRTGFGSSYFHLDCNGQDAPTQKQIDQAGKSIGVCKYVGYTII
jgi:hypothetical protein